jgi:hypothetical protein
MLDNAQLACGLLVVVLRDALEVRAKNGDGAPPAKSSYLAA